MSAQYKIGYTDGYNDGYSDGHDDGLVECEEARKENIRLRADLAAVTEERDRMREALRPFADAADDFIVEKHDAHRAIVTLGELRLARAALEGVTELQQSGAGNENN